MKVVIRTDASLQIGIGHVMRCLTLADKLSERGANCHFVCRAQPGNLLDLIFQSGHDADALPFDEDQSISNDVQRELHPAPPPWLGADWDVDARQTVAALDDTPVDWLIVDHYALDARWEQVLRAHCKKLLVIDDLADRPHVCDVLLDQNLGREAVDYANLVPEHCIVLAGPRFALLRPEFAALREYSLQRRKTSTIKHLLITMGGIDQPNAAGQVLEALKASPLPADCKITVVMGGKAPWIERVRTIAATMPWPTEVRIDIINMARTMAESDLAIGAAGSTSWERCCLGLPTIMVVLAVNQLAGAYAMQALGAASLIGEPTAIHEKLTPALHSLMNGEALERMIRITGNITDGKGAEHVVECMKHLQ